MTSQLGTTEIEESCKNMHTQENQSLARIRCFSRLFAVALCIGAVLPAYAGDEKPAGSLSVTTPGLTAEQFAQVPGVIFARELRDVPGKNLVAVKLEIPPKSAAQPPAPDLGHTHPGSVYVYVIKGSVRFGIEGQPAQVVHAGESAFEPVGAVHTIVESASTTKPASAIAVMIMPDGAPILTPVEGHKK